MSYFEELNAADVTLVVAPHIGGSIAEFSKAGQQLMHKASQRALDDLNPGGMSSFPMVPYCNRIRDARFSYRGVNVELPPNFPPEDHSIHGLGWQAPWQVAERSDGGFSLEFEHDGSIWPWAFRATQRFQLTPDALRQTLDLVNLSQDTMPAGLGVHPFFTRSDETVFRASFAGEWETNEEKIPMRLNEIPPGTDLWEGRPVATRPADNVYTGRDGFMEIEWPGERFGLSIRPTDSLPNTVVYVPVEYSFFCVEPVTHLPNAVNMAGVETGLIDLAPGEALSGTIEFVITEV